MLAEIITIGDEILIGQIVDTNSAWISQQLNLIGVKVKQITSVSDDKQHILQALDEAKKRADIILITGGLGPTKDDITKKTLAEYFHSKLVLNKEMLKQITELFKFFGREVSELNRQQALVPEVCKTIINKRGTAPGMWFESDGKIFISMPGVPFEMKTMMENDILPAIQQQFKLPVIYHKTMLTQGIGESALAELIEKWEEELPDYIKLAYLPSAGMVRLRLSGYSGHDNQLRDEIELQFSKLMPLIKNYVYGYNDDTLESVIGNLLLKDGKTLATAESCTGGNIAHKITSVSGASAYFVGAVVTYDNSIKINELGVNSKDIEQFGAVSQQVAVQMAEGILKKYDVDYVISTTGIAGPTGGSEDKPVGTIWIALAGKGKRSYSKRFQLGNDRHFNIERASLTALNLLRRYILNDLQE